MSTSKHRTFAASRGDTRRAGRSATRQRGEQELAAFYRQHADYVWRIARHLGVPDAELADVVHDVFLVVLRRLREVDGRASVQTWLFHQTRGVVSNRRRGHKRAKRRLKLLEQSAELLTVTPGSRVESNPEAHLERVKAAEFVRSFLSTLKPSRRAIFELVELDGLMVTEAAECLQLNINTAYARLRAARAAFRDAVANRHAEGSSSLEVPCPSTIKLVETPAQ